MENNYINAGQRGKENEECNGLRIIMTIQEVADFLRVHRSTVTRKAKSGEIRSYKLGNRRLFKYDDVLEFFENLVDKQYVFGEEL